MFSGRTTTLLLCTLAFSALEAAPTGAQTPGGSPPGGSGGAYASESAVIKQVTCRGACEGIDRLRPNTLVRISGLQMRDVRTVVFLGGNGAQDDIEAKAVRPRALRVDVRVPKGAKTGPVLVKNADGAPSKPSREIVAFDNGAADLAAASGGPVVARSSADRVFFFGTRTASLDVLVRGDTAIDITVTLVRSSDGQEVSRWALGPLAPGTPKRVTWLGLGGRLAQPTGRYEFRVYGGPQTPTPTSASPVPTAAGRTPSNDTPTVGGSTAPSRARAAQVPSDPVVTDSFLLLDHQFPVSGKHTYGEGAGRFGAGRDYGGHQGQDVFARCGTPLVAARGGVVSFQAAHDRAGYYIVIDGAGNDWEYAYMHLQEASPLEKGDRVRTGQVIGAVGDTGRASGCHLHFEIWDGEWQRGGTPIDPLSHLKTWDQ